VLGLDDALESELVRARRMVVELDQPGTDGVKQLGMPVRFSRTPGGPQGPGPVLGADTEDVLRAAGYSDDEVAALIDAGAAAGPAAGVRGSFLA
jgi:crotonobetainyl-CoA:carnitine CoA-transferase CaiB-like acyl-CoA transferase